MHKELENFERNQVWELVDPPLECKPIGTNGYGKTRREMRGGEKQVEVGGAKV
jgi:hypothetical protein